MPDLTARGPGKPTHEDYCLVIGQVVLDAHHRTASLQSQLDSLLPLLDNFRAEIGTLRSENARLKAAPLREA